MGETLFGKVWDAHTVRRLPSGQTQLFVGLHLVPQPFEHRGVASEPLERPGERGGGRLVAGDQQGQ